MIRQLAASAASLALVLAAGECTIRYAREAAPFDPQPYRPAHLTERDAGLRWRMPPAPGRNRLGLRNREIEVKPSGTYRVLFLGDSLVFSNVTPSGASYTEVLESRLNARAAERRFEVVNAGVPGYTTWQELRFLEIYGLEMQPDLVVLGFVLNDLYEPYLHRAAPERLLRADPDAHRNQFDAEALPGSLLGWSYLAHEVVGRARIAGKRLRGAPVFPFERMADFYLAWREHGWRSTERLLREMRDRLADRGVPLRVVVFPVSDQVDDRLRALDESFVLFPQRQILEVCSRLGVPALDLTPLLHRSGGRRLYRDYLHLTEDGNLLIVPALRAFVEEALP